MPTLEQMRAQVAAQLKAGKPIKADVRGGLSHDYDDRKSQPIATGVLDYFPDALAEVARVSFVGNQQHNPGEPLHWAKEKSQDEENTALRHFAQRYEKDTDGTFHAAKAAWRMLAFLQKLIEARRLGLTYQQYLDKLSLKILDSTSAVEGCKGVTNG
jgi:hypothetical protein